MEHNELVSYLKENFRTDPLYRKIHTDGLEHSLFENGVFYQKLTLEDTYSSKQAAELLQLEGKEQTLLNYINRNDLKFYLNVMRQTRFYRYDWESLFKFKMILLLTQNGYNPMDIASFVGTRLATSSIEGNEKEYSIPQTNTVESKQHINDIVNDLFNENMGNIIKQMSNIERNREMRTNLESKKTFLKIKIDTIEDRVRDLADRRVETEEYINFMNQTRSNTSDEEHSGILARVFGRKPKKDTSNVKIHEDRISSLEKRKLKYEDATSDLKEARLTLIKDLEEVQQKIKELSSVSTIEEQSERMINHAKQIPTDS